MTQPDRRALLLLDLQHDFLDDHGSMPVARHQVSGILANAQQHIDEALANGDTVIHIGNEFKPSRLVGNILRHRAAIQGSKGATWD